MLASSSEALLNGSALWLLNRLVKFRRQRRRNLSLGSLVSYCTPRVKGRETTPLSSASEGPQMCQRYQIYHGILEHSKKVSISTSFPCLFFHLVLTGTPKINSAQYRLNDARKPNDNSRNDDSSVLITSLIP
jgi:hypothetical protein